MSQKRCNRAVMELAVMLKSICILMGAGLVLSFSWDTACPCDCSPYQNSLTTIEGTLTTTFSIDGFAYLRGQQVQTLLCVENTGADTVTISSGVSPLNAFIVMADTCVAPEQPGCVDSSLYIYPEAIYFNGDGVRIPPGGCATWSQSWDGLLWDDSLPPTGTFNIVGGLFHYAGIPTFLDFIVPDQGVLLTLTIGDAGGVPVQPISWGLLKSRYRTHQ